MSENRVAHTTPPNGAAPHAPLAPPEKHSLAWKALQVAKTVQARLRFFVLLAAVGGVVFYWDAIDAQYEKWTRPAVAAQAADADSEYWCPMHPTIIRDHPDKCPICGMPLSRRKKSSGETEALPPGVVSRVQLTPYRVALAGIRTEPVEYRPLVKQIEAAGFVEFDERKLTRVTNHISGRSRIDKLYVNVTDQTVAAGDPLAELYSPDLDTTMQNLLDAHRGGNRDLERMTRERLVLWGIDGAQIDEVVKTGKPITHIVIRAPSGGHVLRKYQLEGDYVEEGARLFDVADLTTVWIEAQIFENELAFLQKGLAVHAFPKAYPNRDFPGTLSFIHPHLDAETRTLKVRFDVDNPGHVLRPGMYALVKLDVPAVDLSAAAARVKERLAGRAAADAAIHSLLSPTGATVGAGLAALMLGAGEQTLFQKGEVLSVPESAVIDTGDHKIVYREAGPNLYEGVEVELGPRCQTPDGGEYFPVVKGLEAGDRAATAGSFLIDAETRLGGGAGSTYFGASGGPGQKEKASVAATARPSASSDEDGEVKEALDKLSPEDRRLVEAQGYCPVLKTRLGSMGVPAKVILQGRPVFLCCPLCVDKANKDPQGMLDKLERMKAKDAPPAK